MGRKILLAGVAVFAVLLIAAGAGLGFMYDSLENEFKPDTTKPIVLGLPATFVNNPVVAPYSGPHPRLIQRPQETFNFPIKLGETGPVQPLFSGPLQYPFLCMTEDSGLGQPLVDNQDKAGIAVYKMLESGIKTGEIEGFSKDCSLPTQILYYYQPDENSDYVRLKQDKNSLTELPQAVSWLRIEVGTINRFIYALILPVTAADLPEKPDTSLWNNRLIYHFKGGISIGFRQGQMNLHHITRDLKEQLNRGYAIAYSTGTETANHYDIWLSEDTALRVKKQFIAEYGEPLYTVGIGGSGGAIQQYLLAQNHPGIIDGAITLYSYPDMITQIPYSLDCELFEYYFDVTARHNQHWQNWNNREEILGLSSIEGFPNKFGVYKGVLDVLNFHFPDVPSGASECSNGWRGPHALINNPKFNGEYYRFDKDIQEHTQWSHWENLVKFYGSRPDGYANSLFDNDGVQYGLAALKKGEIDVATFLHLNSYIGGWKDQEDMQNEFFWHISGNGGLRDLKIWSQHNMTHGGRATPLAKRTIANPAAITGAYNSGMVFTGAIDIPVIDLRHYLDDQLDIHHSWASFTSRLRIQEMMGNYDNQLIWTARKPHKPFQEAFDALDSWILNHKAQPQKSLGDVKPVGLSDRCYNDARELVYEGDDAWDGGWNNKPAGPCSQAYPQKSSPRLIAGDHMTSEVIKCQLQSVESALKKGVYGPVDMHPYLKDLKTIFPDGVCDYDAQPQGKPAQLLQALKKSVQHKG